MLLQIAVYPALPACRLWVLVGTTRWLSEVRSSTATQYGQKYDCKASCTLVRNLQLHPRGLGRLQEELDVEGDVSSRTER